MTIHFSVSGMSCGHCTNAVAKAIAKIDSHAKVSSNLETQTVSVDSQAEVNLLKSAIEDAGYPVSKIN